MAILFSNKVSGEFVSEVKDMTGDLSIEPSNLMFVMDYETAGTFSPSIQHSGSKATGLIGFLPSTAIGLGTTIENLKLMSPVDQLRYVYEYLKDYRGDMVDLFTTYLAVLYPAAINESDDYVFPNSVVKSNPSFFVTGNTMADFKKGVTSLVYQRVPPSYYNELLKKKEVFCEYIKRRSSQPA